MKIIIITTLIHILPLILYPSTTFLGFIYLFVSNILWISFLLILNAHLANIKLQNKYIILITIYFLTILSIISFYPQKDSKTIIQKLIDKKYPTRLTIYQGFKQLWIDMKWILIKNKKDDI